MSGSGLARSLPPADTCPEQSGTGIWLPVSVRAAAREPAWVCGRVNMIPRLLSWRTAVGPLRNSCRPPVPGAPEQRLLISGGARRRVPRPACLNLEAGCQTLNGDQAPGFVRTRAFAEGDLQREQDQRILRNLPPSPSRLGRGYNRAPRGAAAADDCVRSGSCEHARARRRARCENG